MNVDKAFRRRQERKTSRATKKWQEPPKKGGNSDGIQLPKGKSGQRLDLPMVMQLHRCTTITKPERAVVKTDLFIHPLTMGASLQRGFAPRGLNSGLFISYQTHMLSNESECLMACFEHPLPCSDLSSSALLYKTFRCGGVNYGCVADV